MPKQLNVNLAFTADTSAAKQQIKQLEQDLKNLVSATGSTKELKLTKDLVEAKEAAGQLRLALHNATTSTGSLDLSKFDQAIKASNMKLSDYRKHLSSLGPAGQQAFAKLAQSIIQAEVPLRKTNALLDQFKTTLANTARWQISSSILHGFMGALQGAYGYAQDLNESLNNIRIVTGASVEEMSAFAENANRAAQSLSTTTTQYTDAALIYYQQGIRDQEEIAGRVESTIKLANVSRQSAEEVSDQLTAIWNNFYDGSKSLEYYADVITALGAATASSSEEISTGLQKFAAVADTVGLSYEYATSALATITATTRQSADTVGTGLRTLFTRLQGLKLGETLEDGVDLNKYSKALDTVGVQILDVNGEMKDMDTILDELGQRWGDLSDAQKTALAQTVGGVRQYTNLIALMDNWDFMQENLAVANNSEGTLQEQADIYAESWEAAQKRVKAAAEAIYSDLLNDDFFISITQGFADILEGVDSFIDAIGGLRTILPGLGVLITQIFGNSIAGQIDDFIFNIQRSSQTTAELYETFKKEAQEEASTMFAAKPDDMAGQAQSQGLESQLELTYKLKDAAKHLTEEETERFQTSIDTLNQLNEQVVALGKIADASKQSTKEKKVDLIGDAALANRSDMKAAQEQMTNVTNSIDDMTRASALAKSKLNAFINELKESPDAAKDFDTQLEEIKQDLADGGILDNSLAVQALDTAFKDVGNDVEKIIKAGQDLENSGAFDAGVFADITDSAEQMASGINHDSETLSNYVRSSQQAANATQTATNAMDLQKQKADELGRKIQEAAEKAEKSLGTTGQTIVRAFQGISQLTAGISTLAQVFKTIEDPDMSGWDKFKSILMNLPMAITMCTSGIMSLAEVNTLLTGALAKQNAVESKNLVIKGMAILQSWAKAGADAAAAGATNLLTLAQAALNKVILLSPLMAYVVVIGLAIAAIAGLVFAIKGLINWYNKDANAAKAAAEEAEEFKNKANEAKEAADNLRSSIDKYDSAAEKLAACTKGTQEWRDALREAGTAALETMETARQYLDADEYAQLIAQYRTDKTLNEDLLELAQERADAEASQAQYASAVADKHATDADITSRKTNLAREITGAQGIGGEHGGGTRATENQIKSHLDDLVGSSDIDDFRSRLQSIGVNTEGIARETLAKWRDSVEDMSTEAQQAADTLQMLSEVRVDEILGDNADKYSDAEKAWAAKEYQNGNYQDLSAEEQETKVSESLRTAQQLTSSFGEDFVANLINGFDAATKTVDLTGYAETLTGSVLKGLEGLKPEEMVNKMGWSDAQIQQMADALGVPAETIVNSLAEGIDNAAKGFDTAGEDLVANIFKDLFHNIADNDNLTMEVKQQLAQNIHDAFEQGGEEGVQALLAQYEGMNASQLNEELSGTNQLFNELISTFEDINDLSFESVTEEIKSLHDIINSVNEVGDTISAEQFASLPDQAKEYFAINEEGEYELIGNAQDLKDVIDGIDTEKLASMAEQITGREETLSEAQSMTASGVDLGTAAHGAEYGEGMVFAAPEMDKIEMQIELLSQYKDELGLTNQEISNWTDGLINGNATTEEANEYLEIMAQKCNELGVSEEGLSRLTAENAAEFQNMADALAMSAGDFDELQQMLDNGQINAEAFNKKWQQMQNDLGEGIDMDELQDMTDYIGEAADELEGLSDDLDVNAKALKGDAKEMARVKKGAREVAKDIARFDRGIQDISENMETWQDQLDSGDIQEHSKAVKGLKGAYGDLLDVSGDNLSEAFMTNADNMRDLELAAQGDEDAYDRLAEAARQDMAANIGLNDEEFQAGFQDLMNKYYEGQNLDDLEVGASLNDEGFLAGLSEMVNAAGMTAQQATDYLSSMGVDAEIEETEVDSEEEHEAVGWSAKADYITMNGSVPNIVASDNGGVEVNGNIPISGQFPTVDVIPEPVTETSTKQNKAVSLKVTSAQKSSGGGFKFNNSSHGGGSSGSGRRGGGGGRGRRGGGGSRTPRVETARKQAYKPREEGERYHVIKNQLETLEKQYDKINTAYERAFGANKLALLDKQIKKQDELIKSQKKYVKEISDNLEKDRKNLQNKGKKEYWSETDQKMKTVDTSAKGYLGMDVKLDKNGDITNYDALMKEAEKRYNARVDEYNRKEEALVKQLNKTSDEDDREKINKKREELKRIMEEADAQYEGFIENLEQYEETYDLLLEEQQRQQEMLNEKFDMMLEKTDLAVTLKVDVSDDALKVLDFMLERIDEDAYKAAERIALIGKQADQSFKKLDAYKEGLAGILNNHGMKGNKLVNQMMQGKVDPQDIMDKLTSGENTLTDAEVEKMREYVDGLLEEANNLAEYRLQVIDEIGVVMEANMDQLDRMADKMDHLKGVAQSYKNIVDLTGKAYLGISTNMYDQMEATNVQLSKQSLNQAKSSMDFANNQLKIVQDSYDQVKKDMKAAGQTLSKEEKLHWEQQIKDAEDYAQEMTQNYYSSWEEALEAVNTRYESMMKNIAEDFSKAMAGDKGRGNLEGLKQELEMRKKIRDVYVPEYEKVYQLTKLTRDAQKQIDETNNVKVKRELQKVQEKILAAQKEGNKLSQYDIDYLQKELELKAAQMALEEAAQVKSQVRMTRDSEGNYSYVYTADNKAVEDAEDNYANKLYEMQKLNEEYIDGLQDQMLQLQDDFINAINDAEQIYGRGTTEYVQAVERITAEYQEFSQEINQQAQNAIANQAETASTHAALYREMVRDNAQANVDLTTSWSETLLAQETGYDNLQEYQDAFEKNSTDVMTRVKDATTAWKDDMASVYKAAGVDITTFGTEGSTQIGSLETALKGVKKEANKLDKQLNDPKTGLFAKMTDGLNKTTTAVTDWEKIYSEKIKAAIRKNRKLAESINAVIEAASTTTTKKKDTTTTTTTTTKNSTTTTTKKKTTTTKSKYRLGGQKYTIKSGDTLWGIASRKYGNGNLYHEIWKNNKKHMRSNSPDLIYPGEVVYLNTGGYTGTWTGRDGKLAMLHQKELVLNAKDTENMLAIVNMVREIAKVIDINAMSAGSGLSALSAPGVRAAGSVLDQNVHITAEFPNATNRQEIIAAFDNVINLASQYANRK